MILTDKLNKDNFEHFYILLNERKELIPYQPDFYEYYKNKTIFQKFFIKKLVRLLVYNNEYIGYVWFDSYSRKSTRIKDMYVKPEYIKYVNSNTFKIIKSNIIICETFESDYSVELCRALDLDRYKNTELMILRNADNNSYTYKTDAIFRPYIIKRDQKLRKDIQNKIFNSDGREPITTADIAYEEEQEYFIYDLCSFIKAQNNEIGYGQIIISRGTYSIVNLGIIENYRNKGYGHDLVIKLIELANKKGITELFIRVEESNNVAKKLYESLGFNEVGKISKWLWTK